MDTSIREITTQATLQEKKKLRKELRLFDMIFFIFTAIVGIDTIGAISSNGPQALSWLLISALTFVIPYGLLAAELGSTFSQEGGVYEWCKLAGGRFYAALASTFYWISNPIWLGGLLSVTAIAAIKTFWFGNGNIQWGGSPISDAVFEIIVGLIFIWGTTWCAITSLHFGKWLSVVGSYAKIALFAVFSILALIFFFGGHAQGAHFGPADLNPFANFGIVLSILLPALIFNWAGFELPNSAGEEMHNPQRDVPRSVIRAGISVVIAYAIPITLILFVLPKNQIANVGSFVATFQVVAGILPGPLAIGLGILIALGAIIALASSGGTWIICADRTYAISSLDRTGPVFLGRFSGRFGTPITVNTLSGIVASIVMVVAVLINALSSGSSLSTLFQLVFGLSISTTILSYLFIFPAYIILKYKYRNVRRIYSVPGGMIGAWIVTVLCFGYIIVASYFTLIPTDDVVNKTQGISRFTYEMTQFTPLVIIILLTIGLYVWGHLEKRNEDVVIELHLDQGEQQVVSEAAGTADD